MVWAAGCARAATSSLESTAGSQQLVARVTAVVLTVAQLGTGNALACSSYLYLWDTIKDGKKLTILTSDSTLKFSFSIAAELLVRSVVAISVPIAQFRLRHTLTALTPLTQLLGLNLSNMNQDT